MLIALGIVLIVVGALGTTGTVPFVHHVARLWPREITPGDVSNFVATSFIFRFVSLLMVVAGIALILAEVL
jgi:hypothetical protein